MVCTGFARVGRRVEGVVGGGDGLAWAAPLTRFRVSVTETLVTETLKARPHLLDGGAADGGSCKQRGGEPETKKKQQTGAREQRLRGGESDVVANVKSWCVLGCD
jgi:hypothetical protein